MNRAEDLHWDKLGLLVRQRRDYLGYTRNQVNAAHGPSAVTLGLIESAAKTNYQPRVYPAIEDALGWTRGSCRQILEGGEPTEIPPAVIANPSASAPADLTDDELIRLAASIGITKRNRTVFVAAVRSWQDGEREQTA